MVDGTSDQLAGRIPSDEPAAHDEAMPTETAQGEFQSPGDAPRSAQAARVVTLDYAPRPRISRRVRRVAWIVALILLAGGAWYWGRAWWRQVRVVWDQRKLTHFKAPEGTVAFTNDPDEAKRLLSGGRHVRVNVRYMGSGSPYPSGLAGYSPSQADELFDLQDRRRGIIAWDGSNEPFGPPPTLFLGFRRPAGGQRRLMHVTMWFWWDYVRDDPGRFVRGDEWPAWLQRQKGPQWWEYPRWGVSVPFWRLILEGDVYAPASLRPGSTRVRVSPPLWSPTGSRNNVSSDLIVPKRMRREENEDEANPHLAGLRILYGQADPGDESKIIIPYVCDGEKGRFVGTVKADKAGERVEWEVEGPIKAWPSKKGP